MSELKFLDLEGVRQIKAHVAEDLSAKVDKTTTITAGSGLTGGGALSDNRTISHADTSNVSNVTASGRKYITGLTFDGYGHVTGTTTGTETVTNTDTKVTAVGNHYTPTANSASELKVDASSTTAATWGSTDLVTGINLQRDAAGHVTGVTVDSIQMPANPDTGATKVSVTGSGNAVTTASYDASTRTITLTKGATYNNYSLPVATSSALGGVKSGGDITVNSAGAVTVNEAALADKLTITSFGSNIFEYAASMSANTEAVLFSGSIGTSIGLPETYCVYSIKKGINGRTLIDCYALNTQTHYTNGNMDASNTNGWTGWTKWAKESFKNVAVGSTTIAADAGDDTLTLVAGSNVILTPDATNDKITIAATDTTYSAATTSAAGLMSAADKTKLNGIATGANKYTLPVAGTAIGGVKSGTDITVDSSGNVSVVNDSHTHSNSTITSLDASKLTGIVPAANLPSYVDDVIEVANYNALPLTGESGKIYVDLTTNLTYRWSGSAYIEISPGTSVTYSQTLTSGTEIGKITIDGITTKLYSPTSVSYANRANQVNTTLFDTEGVTSGTSYYIFASDVSGEQTPLMHEGVYLRYDSNTSGGAVLVAPSYEGDLTGNADTATTATNANNLKITSDAATTSKLPILFSGTASPTSGNNYAIKYNTNVTVLPSTGVLYGAAWNDYAEYRKFDGDKVEAGRVVTETGKDSVQYTNSRLQFAPAVISDTYGMVIGEDKEGNVPLAIGGKVLAYPYESRETYKVGDAVCSGPNGTVSRMTRKEIVEWPDRILGYYVGTPEDEEFNGVPVNGRIWIRIR